MDSLTPTNSDETMEVLTAVEELQLKRSESSEDITQILEEIVKSVSEMSIHAKTRPIVPHQCSSVKTERVKPRRGGVLHRNENECHGVDFNLLHPRYRSRRLHVPAPVSRPGPGSTSRPRLHVPAPAPRPGPGSTSRPRFHVPAPAPRPDPGSTSRPRLHAPAPAFPTVPLPPWLFFGRLGSVP
uniref:Uncharacterized protein n=1 Tax=Knipowitschia caucasica TaxID=637954 RepID=A0AAV2J0G4_KNICA